MNHHSSYFIVLILLSVIKANIVKAIPQDYERSTSSEESFEQQSPYRQGSIDEFLALRPTKPNNLSGQEPCFPLQFYPIRNKRSSQFKNNMLRPVYHLNSNVQHINKPNMNLAKPPYHHYGGYFCGNQKPQRPIQKPGQSNKFSQNTF